MTANKAPSSLTPWRLCTTVILLGLFGLSSVGCVAQREVDRLTKLNRKKDEQIIDLKTQLEEAEQRIAVLRNQTSEDPALQEQIDRLKQERDRLRDALAEAEEQLRQAGSGVELPQQVSDELARLAQEYPDLMSYDPDLGMIQLKSDLTFDLGSANVKEGALGSLRRLADVLTSPAAQTYEIRVVGHTDTVPISNPATRAKHPTNWHLSAHRAIAVKDALDDAGINARRFNVAGYGPYRPIAPNTRSGNEKNRRVEIYLVPMTSRDQRMMNRVNSNASNQRQPQQQEPQQPAPTQDTQDTQDKGGADNTQGEQNKGGAGNNSSTNNQNNAAPMYK